MGIGGGFQGEKNKKGWYCGSAVYPCKYRDWVLAVCRLGKVWRFRFCNNGLWRDML